MPPLSRWYIKLAILYFVGAMIVGVLQAAMHLPYLGPAYVHMLVVGWVTQMIFGVAYWMFPKFSPDKPRGDDAIAIATFVLLNAGLLLRIVVEPLRAARPDVTPGWLLVIAGAAQALAGIGFAVNTWPRVKVR
jgi:hypothetical protein